MKLLDKLLGKDKVKVATLSKEAEEMIDKIIKARGQAIIHLAHSFAIGEGHPETINENNVDRAIGILEKGSK